MPKIKRQDAFSHVAGILSSDAGKAAFQQTMPRFASQIIVIKKMQCSPEK
jgi:hypothetical protein